MSPEMFRALIPRNLRMGSDCFFVNQLGHFDTNRLPIHLGEDIRGVRWIWPDRIGINLPIAFVHFLGPVLNGQDFLARFIFSGSIKIGRVPASPIALLHLQRCLAEDLLKLFAFLDLPYHHDCVQEASERGVLAAPRNSSAHPPMRDRHPRALGA